MPGLPKSSGALLTTSGSANGQMELSRLAERLPPLLSVIAGMVDLIGFFTLGNIFTAHVTGNLVVAAAATVHGVALTRLLLVIQFLLLAAVLVFSVTTQVSASPHGLMAGIAVMIAVCAM